MADIRKFLDQAGVSTLWNRITAELENKAYNDSELRGLIKANTDVQVAGEICYISNENVELTGTDTVSIRGTDDSFETDVYTYIIYK